MVEHLLQELKSVVKQPVFEGVARVVELHMRQQGSEEGDGIEEEYDHDQDLDLLVEQVEPNFEELQLGFEADAGIDAH